MNDFYRQVWDITAKIPLAKVATYGQLAKLIGKPRYARQVSYALAKHRQLTPQMRLPWHRVINSQGRIAFKPYDFRFAEQLFLLQKEGVVVLGGRINLQLYQWANHLN